MSDKIFSFQISSVGSNFWRFPLLKHFSHFFGSVPTMLVACVTSCRVLQSFTPKLRNVLRSSVVRSLCENPTLRPLAKPAVQSFGVLLDIDGVLVRGRKAIPGAREALEMLQQSEIPTVYLTNAGSESEKEAAERLSYKIGFEVIT